MVHPEIVASTPGVSVAVLWPVDLRPSEERMDNTFYWTVPSSVITHGDVNIEGGAEMSLIEMAEHSLQRAGYRVVAPADAQLIIRPFMIHHKLALDASDATLTDYATAGLASFVSGWITPTFVVGRVHLRLDVLSSTHRVLCSRDLRTVQANSATTNSLVRAYSLWMKNNAKDHGEEVMGRAYTQIGRQLIEVVNSVEQQRCSGGYDPDEVIYWSEEREDLVGMVEQRWDLERLRVTHGLQWFDPVGHNTQKGQVVGYLGLPNDLVGLSWTFHDEVQLLVQVNAVGAPQFGEPDLSGSLLLAPLERVINAPLVGLNSRFGLGFRSTIFRLKDHRLAGGLTYGLDLSLDPSNRWKARFAGGTTTVSAVWSAHFERSVPFFEAGLQGTNTPDGGAALSRVFTPGLSFQLFPTVAVVGAVKLKHSTTSRVTPQIGVSLR